MNRSVVRGLLALLFAGTLTVGLVYRERLDYAGIADWVALAGPAGPLLFVGVYALATVLFLPGAVLTLAGGALFGPVWGSLYNLVGATLGATLAFLAGRHLAAHRVQAALEKREGGRIDRLMKGVEAEGWRFVAFARLVPLFPFNLLNYALGLTRIRLVHYMLASLVFMLPGAVAYTYLGYAGREAVAGGEGLIRKGLIALGLLAAVAFIPRLVGRLRERPMLEVEGLKRRLEAGEDLVVLDVRTAADFSGVQGHLAGAQNLPLEELETRLDELGQDPERTVAIMSRTHRCSARAAALLVRHGFADVHVVRGGFSAWLDRGRPSVGGSEKS